jgi:hypothetical protein
VDTFLVSAEEPVLPVPVPVTSLGLADTLDRGATNHSQLFFVV